MFEQFFVALPVFPFFVENVSPSIDTIFENHGEFLLEVLAHFFDPMFKGPKLLAVAVYKRLEGALFGIRKGH